MAGYLQKCAISNQIALKPTFPYLPFHHFFFLLATKKMRQGEHQEQVRRLQRLLRRDGGQAQAVQHGARGAPDVCARRPADAGAALRPLLGPLPRRGQGQGQVRQVRQEPDGFYVGKLGVVHWMSAGSLVRAAVWIPMLQGFCTQERLAGSACYETSNN